jgi:anti-anti-sigma factor
MNVRVETVDGVTIVIPEGRLDFGAAAGFQAQLEQAIAAAGKSGAGLVIDGSGLDYVSSAGLRVFLIAAREMQRRKLSFSVCALKPAVREVFELSGFTRIIAVHADRAAALASRSSG